MDCRKTDIWIASFKGLLKAAPLKNKGRQKGPYEVSDFQFSHFKKTNDNSSISCDLVLALCKRKAGGIWIAGERFINKKAKSKQNNPCFNS